MDTWFSTASAAKTELFINKHCLFLPWLKPYTMKGKLNFYMTTTAFESQIDLNKNQRNGKHEQLVWHFTENQSCNFSIFFDTQNTGDNILSLQYLICKTVDNWETKATVQEHCLSPVVIKEHQAFYM